MAVVTNPSSAAALFQQAASAGRSSLNASELQALLGDLGIAFDTQAAPAGALDLHIGLASTREFGMVISAGLGGLEGELDERNFRRDRAAVHAAAALTDAADFLGLFKRTLAYQKLAAVARRDRAATPDDALQASF